MISRIRRSGGAVHQTFNLAVDTGFAATVNSVSTPLEYGKSMISGLSRKDFEKLFELDKCFVCHATPTVCCWKDRGYCAKHKADCQTYMKSHRALSVDAKRKIAAAIVEKLRAAGVPK